jgi:hypothetical protein
MKARATPAGIAALLGRWAAVQARAAFEAAVRGDADAAARAAQAAQTYAASADPDWKIAGWYELCRPCERVFAAWRDAKDPADPGDLPPHVVALLHTAGYDPVTRGRQWRENVSYALVFIRALCTAGYHRNPAGPGQRHDPAAGFRPGWRPVPLRLHSAYPPRPRPVKTGSTGCPDGTDQ